MRLQREEVLRVLDAMEPGISRGGDRNTILEQSDCFTFADGLVTTFNDELFCQAKSPLGKFTGAVQAKPLLDVLRLMPESELEFEPENGHMVVSGRNRKSGIRLHKKVLLMVEKVGKPGKFQALHKRFTEAIDMVRECASNDERKFNFCCVHMTPDWVEACDNRQMARYRLKTGLVDKLLIKHKTIKHAVTFGVTEFCETPNWVFFRNPDKFTLACRRWTPDPPYKDLEPPLSVKGVPTRFPKGLVEAAKKAEVFSREDADNNKVMVELRPGRLRIRGQGASGWHTEVKKLDYDGESMEFMVSPKLLVELVTRYEECEVATSNKIKVDGGRFVYVACLSAVQKEKK